MSKKQWKVEGAPGYQGVVYQAPLPDDLPPRLIHLLGHKGEPWLADIEARAYGEGLDLSAVAFCNGEPVAHCALLSSVRCAEIGVIGHVYTMEEHRRRGLAASLMAAALERFDAWGGRWLTLSTGNDVAAHLYEKLGFRTVNSADEGGGRIMLRGAEEGDALDAAYFSASGKWQAEPYEREHYAGLSMLLGAWPGRTKMPLIGVRSGVESERQLLLAYEEQERGDCTCSVLVDAASARPHGMACRRGGTLEIYAPEADSSVIEVFARQALRSAPERQGARPLHGYWARP